MHIKKTILIFFLSLIISGYAFSQKKILPDFISLPDSMIKVDSIRIKGNDETNDSVILRELTFQRGDSISTGILKFNRERVFSLGLFNNVEIYYKKEDGLNKIIINVEESWYIYPIPFIRFKDRESSKTSYGINLMDKNFRGMDETIRANLSFGYDPSFSINYNIPVLFNSKKLGIGLLFNYSTFVNKTNEGIRLNNGDFNYEGIISRIYLNYRIDQFNLLVPSLGYEYYEAPNKNFVSITASNGRIDRFPMAGFEYIYDSRDLKQYAKVGTYFDFSCFHKGFGIYNINYNILNVDLREYQTLLEELTWKGRFTSRTMIGENIPLYDYSLLGYQEYVRGASKKKFDGKTYILASTEFSIPLVKEWDMKLKLPLLPESLTSGRIGINFTIFADAGNAFDSYTDFSYKSFTYGWGFGINFLILPYNGFRIEYAFDRNMKGEVLIASGFSF